MRHILAALILAGFAILAVACNDDAPAPGPCGNGEAISTDDGLHCVYPNDLIIEGFLCPTAAPHRHDFKSETVCSSPQDLADAFITQLRDRGYGAEPTDPSSPGDPCAVPGATTLSDDGCNTCSCTDGGWVCTLRACVDAVSPGDPCSDSGATAPAIDGCNSCQCDGASWSCTEIACACTDGETTDDGCNTCECSGGAWACTERACACVDGQTMNDGCNECVCSGGDWACDTAVCACTDGETMTTDDGCNTCTCNQNNWVCTQRACISCADVQDEETCLTLDCSWNTCPQDDVVCPAVTGTFCSDRATPGEACDLDPAIRVDAIDGCNTCTCTEQGWACTEIACGN